MVFTNANRPFLVSPFLGKLLSSPSVRFMGLVWPIFCLDLKAPITIQCGATVIPNIAELMNITPISPWFVIQVQLRGVHRPTL